MSTAAQHLDYIKQYLLKEIVVNFNGETLLDYEVDNATGLDGFMSALYTIKLKTKQTNGAIGEHLVIAKFMKGNESFRESSKSYIQFSNEIYVYAEVLPAFKRFLAEAGGVHDVSTDNWVAPVYVAKFGYIDGLSSTSCSRESILVLKHLKPDNYRLGPRLYLRRDQLLAACKPVAQYHALSYAMRCCQPNEFERLRAGIKPLSFRNENDPNDNQTNIYHALYRVAFDRFFEFFDRKAIKLIDKETENGAKLIKNLENLRGKYFNDPTVLMQCLYEGVNTAEDRNFGVILHGDYNRNNVLFHFKPNDTGATGDAANDAEVDDAKMIDFQELRYGSPAIDLSFIFYMNTPHELRARMWFELLQTYHGHMYDTLAKLLADKKQQILEEYSFDRFYAHFSRFALYGVMVCIHFLPWLVCSEAECAKISNLFDTDMHSPEFYKLSLEIGGDDANIKIFNIVRHACEMGYLDHI